MVHSFIFFLVHVADPVIWMLIYLQHIILQEMVCNEYSSHSLNVVTSELLLERTNILKIVKKIQHALLCIMWGFWKKLNLKEKNRFHIKSITKLCLENKWYCLNIKNSTLHNNLHILLIIWVHFTWYSMRWLWIEQSRIEQNRTERSVLHLVIIQLFDLTTHLWRGKVK